MDFTAIKADVLEQWKSQSGVQTRQGRFIQFFKAALVHLLGKLSRKCEMLSEIGTNTSSMPRTTAMGQCDQCVHW